MKTLKHFLIPPKSDIYERDKQYRFLHITLWFVFFAGIIFGLHNFDIGDNATAAAMFVMSALMFPALYLNSLGHYFAAASLLTSITMIVSYYNFYEGLSMYDSGVTAIPIIITFTAFLFGKKSIPYITAANLAGVVFIVYLERINLIDPPNKSSNARVMIIITLILIAAGLLYLIMSNWETAISLARESEKHAREALNEVNQIKEELEVRVQERTTELTELNNELKTFAYSVSHDLKAPLRAITGFGEILSNEHGDEFSAETQNYFTRIIKNSQMMEGLIDDMLFLSRATSKEITLQRINLTTLAHDIFNTLMEEYTGPEIEFITSECPDVFGDLGLIRIMLTNMISNSIKFMKKEGELIIELGCSNLEEPTFFLRDNGIGFDQDYGNTIFEPFKRLHDLNLYEGTGIGLAIVKRIIRRHRGNIWVESEPGAGTTLYFTIGKIA
ncbi:MAG TPA: ATP-binding protein [Anaerolineales bacterium]|nr:ATP-binding protein [Anaerolineales bacterium]